MIEAIFLISLVVVPVLAGGVAAYLGRPWWWAAIAAVVILVLLAVLPPPEPGEPRVDAEDVVFLLVVALIAIALVWVGSLMGSRMRQGREPTSR